MVMVGIVASDKNKKLIYGCVKDYNIYLDAMKGIGIILVVLYHAIGINAPEAYSIHSNELFNMIASFFMQMFLIISGYLAYGKVANGSWVKHRISLWITPLLLFMLIYWLEYQIFPNMVRIYDLSLLDYIVYTLETGFSGLVLWYLWCLLQCYCLAHVAAIFNLKYKAIPHSIIVVGLLVVLNLFPVALLGILVLKWYAVFFFIGYLLRHYQKSNAVRIGKKFVYVSLGLFPLCGYLFNWMIPYQNINYGTIGLGMIIPALSNGYGGLLAVMMLMALLGTGFVYSLVKIVRNRLAMRIFCYLGQASLGIYLLHVMFTGISSNYWLAALIALGISIIVYELLKRVKPVNRWVLGRG